MSLEFGWLATNITTNDSIVCHNSMGPGHLCNHFLTTAIGVLKDLSVWISLYNFRNKMLVPVCSPSTKAYTCFITRAPDVPLCLSYFPF